MSIFDGLPDPSAPAQAFFAGLAHGKAEQEDKAVHGALSAYAINPDDPQAFRVLAQYKPELAITVHKDQVDRAKKLELQRLSAAAAQGDRSALAQLAGIDLDAYDKLADNQRQGLHTRVEVIGNAALDVASRPEAERPAAWDAYIDQLSQQYPELAPLKGQYSPERLNAAIAQAGQTQTHLNSLRPDYMAIPPGGTLVDTHNPAAVSQFQGGDVPIVSSPEEARKLPPGSMFRTPDGRTLRVPGGAGGNAGGNFPNLSRYYRGE